MNSKLILEFNLINKYNLYMFKPFYFMVTYNFNLFHSFHKFLYYHFDNGILAWITPFYTETVT